MGAVVATDRSPHIDWQVRLLRYSYQRIGQHGSLDVVERPVTVAGDSYAPYARPVALGEWASARAPGGTGVVLDPDMVIVRRFDVRAKRGAVIAHDGGYPLLPAHRRVLRRFVSDPDTLPIPIVPMVFDIADLARVAEPWRVLTRELRADDETRAALGWLCEMWACALAIREAGLRCRLHPLAAIPPLPHRRGVAFVHYAWVTPCFDKRTYRPWTDLPACQHPGHARMRSLIREIAAAGARMTPPRCGT